MGGCVRGVYVILSMFWESLYIYSSSTESISFKTMLTVDRSVITLRFFENVAEQIRGQDEKNQARNESFEVSEKKSKSFVVQLQ